MVPGLCSLCFIKRCRGPCLRLPQESCGPGEPRFRSQIKKTSLGEPITEGESLRANLSTPVRSPTLSWPLPGFILLCLGCTVSILLLPGL